MATDVVVIFVHGINTNTPDYYVTMRDGLLRALPRAARAYVVFRSVFWGDIVRGRAQEFILYARSQFPLTPLHALVTGLGDAAAYQHNSAYDEIQYRLRKVVGDASIDTEDKRPLVLIGHSFGCHIISTYAWDLHRLKGRAADTDELEIGAGERRNAGLVRHLATASPFERMDTFAGFITMGNNMPLFTWAFGPQNVYPITKTNSPELAPAFPGPGLEPNVRAQARWLNFFSANDPFGYPLKPLNEAYDSELLLSDIRTFSEGRIRALVLRGALRQLNAIKAHSGYWTDRNVLRRTADLLTTIINADEIAENKRPRRGK